MVLLTVFVGGLPLDPQRLSAAQAHANAMFDSSSTTDETVARDNERGPPTPSKMDEMVDRIFKREHVEIAAIEQYVPTIETYIQEVKFNQVTGAVPKSDYYFLGQADFGGATQSSLDDRQYPEGFANVVFRTRRVPTNDLHRQRRIR
jgi:hypothetical protein